MLNNDSLVACANTAIKAASQGRSVVAVAGTPLASLVAATEAALAVASYARGANEPTELVPENLDGSYIAHATGGGDLVLVGAESVDTPHDKAMDGFVKDIAGNVRAHLSYAKNVVAPLVMQYITYMNQHMAIDLKSAAAKFSVIVHDLPDPLTNPAFEQTLGQFKGKNFYEPKRPLRLGARTNEEIFALLQTGSKDFDAKIAVWFATLAPSFVQSVWAGYYGQVADMSTPAFSLSALSDGVSTDDGSVLVYLLAQRLAQDIPADAATGLQEYKDALYEITEAAAVRVLGIYSNYTLSVSTNTLVELISFDRRSARVNGTVYRDWLKAGGCNEVILGMLAGSVNARVVPDFDANTEKFKAAWFQFEELNATLARNNSYARFVQGLEAGFAYVNTLEKSEQEIALMEEKPGIQEEMVKYLREELQSIKTGDVECLNETCLRVLTRSRFFYTSAEKILTSINQATKANPNIDVRTAALIATIEYVGDYVADQLQLV